MNVRNRHSWIMSLVGLTIMLVAGTAAAIPTGISGFSGQTQGNTCAFNGCHPMDDTGPKISITGPAELPPGATGQYIFTLLSNRARGGLDVSVDNAGAKLSVVSAMTQLLQGEITHSQPLAVANGQIVVKFDLTAPNTEGTVTLFGDGQADNQPGMDDSGATPTQLKVTIKVGAPIPDLGSTAGPTDMGASGTGTAGDDGGTVAATDDAGAGDPNGAVPPAGGGTVKTKHGCSFAGGADASATPWVLLLVAALRLRRRRGARV